MTSLADTIAATLAEHEVTKTPSGGGSTLYACLCGEIEADA